jgi:hypothetical protein
MYRSSMVRCASLASDAGYIDSEMSCLTRDTGYIDDGMPGLMIDAGYIDK